MTNTSINYPPLIDPTFKDDSFNKKILCSTLVLIVIIIIIYSIIILIVEH